MTPPFKLRRRSNEGGYALVLAIFIILIGGFLAFSYLNSSNTQAHKSVKFGVQTTGGALIENQMAVIGQNAQNQLSQTASVNLEQWNKLMINQGAANNPDSFYTTSSTLAGVNAVAASQSIGSLGTYPHGLLQDSDDPFRGARADTVTTTLTGTATRTVDNPYLGGSGQNDAPLNMQYSAQIDFRRMPVSEWAYYSQGTTTISSSTFPSGNIGRAYTAKDVSIKGAVQTTYPFNTAGNVYMNTSQKSTLTARSSPTDSDTFTLAGNTNDPAWPEYAKSIARTKVMTGRDEPLSLMRPADAGLLTAPPGTVLVDPTGNRAQQELYRQCARVVLLTAYDPVAGKGTFTVYDPNHVTVDHSGEAAAFSTYASANYPSGPIIVFDYVTVQGGGILQPSYYLYSAVPGAAVMVRRARVLAQPLSIVTPLAIYVENGIGDLNPDGSVVAVPTIPVSLTTGFARVFGVKSGW